MYCAKCGQEINDDAVVCPKCGCPTEKFADQKSAESNSNYDEPKTGVGVVCGLFLGLIGLLIGYFVYPEGTVARETFMKACGITIGVCVAIGAVLGIIIGIAGAAAI